MKLDTWDKEGFLRGFSGMTCDLSDAGRLGFELALRKCSTTLNDKDIKLSDVYRVLWKELQGDDIAVGDRFDGTVIQIQEEYQRVKEQLEWLLGFH